MFTGEASETIAVSNEKNLRAVPAAKWRTVPESETPIPAAELQASVVDDAQLVVVHMVRATDPLGVQSHGPKLAPGMVSSVPPDGDRLYLPRKHRDRDQAFVNVDNKHARRLRGIPGRTCCRYRGVEAEQCCSCPYERANCQDGSRSKTRSKIRRGISSVPSLAPNLGAG